MKNQKEVFSILNNLHFQTQLLESLDWDENQLEALFLKISNLLKENKEFNGIIECLRRDFNDNAIKIIYDLFKEESYLFYVNGESKNEH